MKESKFLQVRVTEEVKKALREKAENEGRTITDVVLLLLEGYLNGSIVVGADSEVAYLQQKITQMENDLLEHKKLLQRHSALLGELAA